ncbi:MAG: FUSC family protein [Bryobacteraceae bacterium]
MQLDRLRSLIVAKQNPSTVIHSARTAVAAVVSLLVARSFRLPEAYWAAITTLIVMQSTLGAALPVSAQRLVGTAVGAAFGALAGACFAGNALVFGIGVFAIGLLCAAFRVERSAYRYASITLAIVMLITRASSEWVVAVHRFLEVSIGIAVALSVTALWPERDREASSAAPGPRRRDPVD